MRIKSSLLALEIGFGPAGHSQAEDKSLTLCWAAWDPANALLEEFHSANWYQR